MDLNQFIEWQKKKSKSRHVDIKITPWGTKIWAYDEKLQVGQHVKNVNEIDLEAKKADEERAEFERLKKKFDKKSD